MFSHIWLFQESEQDRLNASPDPLQKHSTDTPTSTSAATVDNHAADLERDRELQSLRSELSTLRRQHSQLTAQLAEQQREKPIPTDRELAAALGEQIQPQPETVIASVNYTEIAGQLQQQAQKLQAQYGESMQRLQSEVDSLRQLLAQRSGKDAELGSTTTLLQDQIAHLNQSLANRDRSLQEAQSQIESLTKRLADIMSSQQTQTEQINEITRIVAAEDASSR